MKRLENKVVLITGGAKGQGAVETSLFAEEGAIVYFTDIDEDAGNQLMERMLLEGKHVNFLRLDVSLEEDWEKNVLEIAEKEGRIDVLINNAAISVPAKVEETSNELWNKMLSVNQNGVMYGMRQVVPLMKKQTGGSIINVASIAGFVGSRVGMAYAATKGAVRFMTKAAALELASFGIRVNTIIPGPIDTDMLKNQNSHIEKIPMGRLGTPLDVAYGALYLASDESSFVTGIDLVIDGGYTTG